MSGSCRSSSTTSGSRVRRPRAAPPRPTPARRDLEAQRAPARRASTVRNASSSSTRRSDAAAASRDRSAGDAAAERGQRDLEGGSRARRAARHRDVAAPAPHEVQRQEEPEPGAALPQAEERLEDPLLVLGRDAAAVVADADARPGRRPRRRRATAPARAGTPGPRSASRLISTCCSSASSARTRRPAGSGSTSSARPSARAPSARPAAPRPASVGAQVDDVAAATTGRATGAGSAG